MPLKDLFGRGGGHEPSPCPTAEAMTASALGPPPKPEAGEGPEHFLARAFAHAKAAMREAGFDIGDAVDVRIDPKLPFMGYTTPRGERYRIVVSGGSLKSGMLEGLLAHEMSHIYRMGTGHVSHDAGVLEAVVASFRELSSAKEYQRKILHDLLNNVEDLYADDISIAVMRRGAIMAEEHLTQFLQEWVARAPVATGDGDRDRWNNAWLVANNARAIAQMQRHHVEDTGGVAAKANAKLLAAVGVRARDRFEFFRALLAGLEEDIGRDEFRARMTEYLRRFLELVEVAERI